jgi:hypothetical protein
MKREPVLRMSMVAVPVMIGCGLVVAASSARVDQEPGTAHDDGDTKACTNRTLHGDYGSSVEGLILSAPCVTFPIRGVVMTHYDGNGTFTQVNQSYSMAPRPRSSGPLALAPIRSMLIAPEQHISLLALVDLLPWSSWWSVKESKSTPWLRLRLMVRIVM